ncbi:MAG: UDP-N-acetylmuramoyl-L-alanyl-D-glutamate--2,6-diaminopimelate ligase, partial [Myxococcota bacterium]
HLPALRVDGRTDRPVQHVTHDSRLACPDGIFVAIRGARVDGRRFTPDLSVAAIICDAPVEASEDVTVITVPDARKAMAMAAAALHDWPGRNVPVVGVTGTNGKTTVCWMIEQIARSAGRRPGVLGTTGHRIDGAPLPDGPLTRFTTPESPILQALLAEMRDQGCDLIAMEASSIGLDAHRADQIPFRSALFTSFSRDHLDYHVTEAAYLAAKQRLFSELLAADGVAILFGDDPRIAATPTRSRRCWRYSLLDPGADLFAADVHASLSGITAEVRTPAGSGTLSLQLVGRHNLENALAALGAALTVGISLEAALVGLAGLETIPGRLQRVADPLGGRHVFVDYAHTPDALDQVLSGLRPLTPGRIVTVFGCGGDRDAGKRPLMGAAASRGSDAVVVTSDNPRGEDPVAIIAAILPGIQGPATVEPDRAAAIRQAISGTGRGDVVLIAGKGHETTQTTGTVSRPFSDAAVAAAVLSEGERP